MDWKDGDLVVLSTEFYSIFSGVTIVETYLGTYSKNAGNIREIKDKRARIYGEDCEFELFGRKGLDKW